LWMRKGDASGSELNDWTELGIGDQER